MEKKRIASKGRLRLTTRPHTLVVIKPGYVTQRVAVTPQQGVSQNVNVTLQQAGQKAAAKKQSATAASITTATGQQLQLIKPGSNLSMGASRREAGRRANESQRLDKAATPILFFPQRSHQWRLSSISVVARFRKYRSRSTQWRYSTRCQYQLG